MQNRKKHDFFIIIIVDYHPSVAYCQHNLFIYWKFSLLCIILSHPFIKPQSEL